MPETAEITWGAATGNHVNFRGRRIPVSTFEQGLMRIGSGPETERSQQIGSTKIKFNDFSGGLVSVAGIQSWVSSLNTYTLNQGIQTRIRGLAVLPYALTAQAALESADFSGTVAANLRLHALNTSLGASGLRWVVALGPRVWTDTSTSNPALVELAGTLFTDSATLIGEGVFNNTNYVFLAYNGTTQDVRGFSTISGLDYSTGWMTLVSLSANDYLNAMQYMQTLGPGAGVAVGTVGGTNQVWYWLGTTAVPVTLQPSVIAATKDVLGSLGTSSTGDVSCTEDEDRSNGGVGWGSHTAPQTYAYLWASDPDMSSVPNSAYIEGLTWKVPFDEDGTAQLTYSMKTYVDGSAAGIGKSGSVATDNTITFGSTTSRLGTNLRGADLRGIALRTEGSLTTSAGAGNSFTYGNITLAVTYRMPGTSLAFPNGGWQVTPNPAFPTRLAMVAPESADKTAILVPRKLWFLDFEWDVDGARPVFTPSTPNTGMRYVHHATPYQGGYAITGGDVAGPGRFVRFVDGSGQLRNLNMPPTNGSAEWRCNSLVARGSWLIGDMVTTDYTNRQWWLFKDGKWYPDTLMQSLSSLAIASQPIPFAENALGLQQQQIYTLFPVADTALAAVRQFLPEDLDADPRLVNTSQIKSMAYTSNTTEDTALLLRSPELDFGPEEAKKTLTTVDFQGRSVDASETVRSRINTGGDTSFTAAEVTKEFTAFSEHYDIPSAGVAYQTLIHELGLKHTAASADTPNGASVLYTSVQQWEQLQKIDIVLDNASIKPDVFEFFAEMLALQSTKSVQPLKVGDEVFDVAWEGLYYTLASPPARGQPPALENLRQWDGKTQLPRDVDVIARFRQVRKTSA